MYNNSDKFDHLIALAATKCIEDDAQELNALDTSNVVFDASYYRKRNRYINQCKRRSTLNLTKTVAIRIAVALMIIITLGCVMIGCVPDWRQAIYEAIVEWYDNCFAVHYEDLDGKEKETTYVEENTTVVEPISNAPSSIENVKKPSDLPEGVWEDIVINKPTQIIIDYYLGEKYQCTFTQTVLKPNDKYVDNEDIDVTYIEINGNDATIVECENKREIHIFWNDGEYSYNISSTECGSDILIGYAKSVK